MAAARGRLRGVGVGRRDQLRLQHRRVRQHEGMHRGQQALGACTRRPWHVAEARERNARNHARWLHAAQEGGGGNPFDMKNLMESVKKAQTLVQQETARVQQELAEWVGAAARAGVPCSRLLAPAHSDALPHSRAACAPGLQDRVRGL